MNVLVAASGIILGDGHVALILDVDGIVANAGTAGAAPGRALLRDAA